MSKGLGKIQTDIIAHMLSTPGAGIQVLWRRGRYITKLYDGLRDMRRVSRDLGNLSGRRDWCQAFSRAVRTLETRGLIEFPRPIRFADDTDGADDYENTGMIRLADGILLMNGPGYSRQQRHFGRLRGISKNYLNAYTARGAELVDQLAERDRQDEARFTALAAAMASRERRA